MKKDVKEAGSSEELRHIVRINNADLEGKRQVQMALCGIKGVGRRCARLFALKADVDPHATLGLLPEEKIDALKKVVGESQEIIPIWMMNRRKDLLTGLDRHVMGTDVDTAFREDLDVMKKSRSYKGIRHERGLRVRGQRTRSTGRTGATVGVTKKKVQPGTAEK